LRGGARDGREGRRRVGPVEAAATALLQPNKGRGEEADRVGPEEFMLRKWRGAWSTLSSKPSRRTCCTKHTAARMDGHFLPFSSASFSLHSQQTVRQKRAKIRAVLHSDLNGRQKRRFLLARAFSVVWNDGFENLKFFFMIHGMEASVGQKIRLVAMY
jgi:hypothetical protein